ncbi:MAG: thioredoxin domain-containing protein [Myxococcales bacterium]|nr:thioredoxin domain-containing protein [Myxococcales bacterium]
MTNLILASSLFTLWTGALLAPLAGTPAAPVEAPPQPGAKVSVELYVMSKCPYCAQIMEELGPLLEDLRDHVDFRVGFVGTEVEGRLSAMHGESEVAGNLLEICVQRLFGNALPGFMRCMGRNLRAIPEGWESCAAAVGVDVSAVRTCADSGEGQQLLRESYREASARGVRGSPTLFIGGEKYQGNRSRDSLLMKICAAGDLRAPVCQDLPPIPRVRAVILSDRRCATCQARHWQAFLNRTFENLDLTELDYLDPAGKALHVAAGKPLLPAVVLDASVDALARESTSPVWDQLKAHGDYRVLATGSKFDPTAEICDNGIDDTGDGRADCRDPACKESISCRLEKPGELRLFLMSQCPFAARAVQVLPELMKATGLREVRFHFVVGFENGQMNSLHGSEELAENRRMACVQKNTPKKSLAYVGCRMRNPRDPVWEPCATEAGLNPTTLGSCADGAEGERLLREDARLCALLGIQASPTWFANNRYPFSGIQAEDVAAKYCAHNGKRAACRTLVPRAEREGP